MYPYALFLDVTLYDLFLSVGVMMALVVFYFYSAKLKLKAQLQILVLFSALAAIAFGFFTAVLTQSVYNYIETGVFRWSGMTFYGGLVGGAAMFFVCYFVAGHFVFRKSNTPNYHLKNAFCVMDIAACSVLLAHALGRLGCLTAGCCHGAVYSEPHAGTVPLLTVNSSNTLLSTQYMVPVQLYEALFLFVLFAALSAWVLLKKPYAFPLYLILYGVWRFFIEYARADDRGQTVLSFLTPSQLTAILLVMGGAALLGYEIYLFKKKKAPAEGEQATSQEA